MWQVVILSLVIFCCSSIDCLTEWPNHDASTLRLVQIVHRHGDRNPKDNSFSPQDPFQDENFWPNGHGELTEKGKRRMWLLGRHFRFWYDDFLSPKLAKKSNVFVRSSLHNRCFESAAYLLSGLGPASSQDQNGIQLSSEPISTVSGSRVPLPGRDSLVSIVNDTILMPEVDCPMADKAADEELLSSDVIAALKEEEQFIKTNITPYYGKSIKELSDANRLHDTLLIEAKHGYFWPNWPDPGQLAAVDRMRNLRDLSYRVPFRNPVVNHLRAGPLLYQIIKHMNDSVAVRNGKKFLVYSTHGSMVSLLMHALDIYKNQSKPRVGATVIFELHQENDSNASFVKVYYLHDTDRPEAPQMKLVKGCPVNEDGRCSLISFIRATKEKVLRPDLFDSACQINDLIETK